MTLPVSLEAPEAPEWEAHRRALDQFAVRLAGNQSTSDLRIVRAFVPCDAPDFHGGPLAGFPVEKAASFYVKLSSGVHVSTT